jgi:predicted pyridoxine 5'-phosphate oxidase superfamily flavin-nucleotide-binding protein
MELPQKVKDLFERLPLVAFGTSSLKNEPNVNTVFWKKIIDDDRIILIDNFFKTTKANLLENAKVCITFWDQNTEEGYKIKGDAKYFTKGDIYEIGKEYIQEKNPNRIPNGVVEIKVNEIYILTPGKDAGKKLES